MRGAAVAHSPIPPPDHGPCALTGCGFIHVGPNSTQVAWPVPVEDGCVAFIVSSFDRSQTWREGNGG